MAETKGTRSLTVDFLKVALTVGIVLRHSELVGQAGLDVAYDGLNRGMMLLTELFVPMFFVLSGYLFFRNVPEKPGVPFFAGKWKSRVFSLVIPYIIANCIAFACYWAAYRYWPSMMSGFFGDGWKNPLFVFWTGPVNMSLWFIRDLIIAVLVSPVVWLLVRYTRFWGVLALGLVCFFVGMKPWCNFYFVLGAWAAVCKVDVASACRKTGPWWLLAYILAFAATLRGNGSVMLSVFCGLPVLIWLADLVCSKCRVSLSPSWQAWCFFIYLYHYIPVIALKKLLPAVIRPQATVSLLLTYFAVALVTLALVSGIYLLMKKITPRITKLIVGGKI